MVYMPVWQPRLGVEGTLEAPTRLTMSMRTTADAGTAASRIRGETRSISQDAIVLYLRTMEQQIDAMLIPERLLTLLSRCFAGIALLLACVGLYGVMAYNVARRTREIGLRIALGAVPGGILSRVLRETVIVWAMGLTVGLSAALAVMRPLASFLFGLTPHDPATLASVAGLLLVVALLAGFLPARRAAAVDPIRALRE
jgi:ABC-type antimicrobial peptide transport system permease subunit